MTPIPWKTEVRQLTVRPHGHILTNFGVWSPDSRWIAYDVRLEESRFEGNRIEAVHVETGEVRTLFSASRGACCGVVTWHPSRYEILFISSSEDPTPDWSYGPSRRHGTLQSLNTSDLSPHLPARHLDARDLAPPFTAGALRGGSHVHVYHPDASRVSFTYDDEVLSRLDQESSQGNAPPSHEPNLRNIGVTVMPHPVSVPDSHPRNHGGEGFSVLVTRTRATPTPGSDEIRRACEEAWVGTHGYLRPDGSRQIHALAFQGEVLSEQGVAVQEVFLVDLPQDLTQPGSHPLQGTPTTRPAPPAGVQQRRLTHTLDRKFPGIHGPRHWLRSSPDGRQIAFCMRDEQGISQIWTVSPWGDEPIQRTRHDRSLTSPFSWSPDGRWLAYVLDNSVFITAVPNGISHRLTPRYPDATAPRHHACVFSPDGRFITFMRTVSSADHPGSAFDQVSVVEIPESLRNGA